MGKAESLGHLEAASHNALLTTTGINYSNNYNNKNSNNNNSCYKSNNNICSKNNFISS